MTGRWWRDAVVYQVYVRSFADSDGDGVGDLPGITARLEHIAGLGADAVWLTPFYRSPMADHGYDVTDQCDVDPIFGTLQDADALLARAHEIGLKVIVDLVPNHSSVEHRWFREALADPGKRDRYHFRDGVDGGPPNNWQSVFRGPAWTQVPDGQWYLHLFDEGQPDFNWRNPEVHGEWERILRFWLDRGVDGFRVDVAHGLYKSRDLADNPPSDAVEDPLFRSLTEPNTWDQPEVVEVYRRWREIIDAYDDRVMVGEVFLPKVEKVKRFVGKELLHQSFNFPLLAAPLEAATWRSLIEESLAAFEQEGAGATWVLSNHDVVRHATRYGGGEEGVARARAATLTLLGLPGSPYLYAGEELGLEQDDLPPEFRQDPVWMRTEGAELGRDGCRTPLPWTSEEPGHGFTTGTPWLPFGDQAKERNVESDPPTLSFYKRALALRRQLRDELPRTVEWLDLGDDVLGYRRGSLTVALNTGVHDVALPAGEVVVASSKVDGVLPPGTAVWLRS